MIPLFALEIEGSMARWRVSRVHGHESLHAPFAFEVIATALDAADAPEALLMKKARLTWPQDAGGDRVVEGIVDGVERAEAHYEISIVSPVALLGDGQDHRVFIDKDALAIATEVFQERGLRLESRVVRALPKRPQCVQLFESDLAFVSRILADEGVTWFVATGAPDVVIAADRASGFDPIDEPLRVVETGGFLPGRSAYTARVIERVTADKVSLRDFDFLAPQLELKGEAAGERDELEAYEFPGAFRDPDLGRVRACLRLEQLRCRARTLYAAANARDLAAGRVVKLHGEVEGEWLLIEVEHDGEGLDGDGRYRARFAAIPHATAYRPARVEAPRMSGIQHATTTGPKSMEIHTEAHARVKALLRWDRRGARDDKSSAWIRTAQPPTSGGFFLPRVGWEALLGFSGGSADYPIVLGRLYNAEAPPPNALPKDKVVSAFGTLTTPGAGSGNLVAMNDAAGAESMTFVASSDFNERTENDKVTSVKADEKASIGGSRKLIVGQVHELGVAGAQTHAVGGSREVNVNANMSISAGSETIAIGGLRKFKVGGDSSTGCSSLLRVVAAAKVETAIEHQTRAVSGASAILVAGSWNAVGGAHASVSVGGASVESVGGPKRVVTGKYFLGVKGALKQSFASRSVTAGASHDEGFNGAASYDISGSASFKGADVIIAADSKLTVKASGITIEITPGAVTIDGKFDGSVGSVDQGDEKYA